MDNSPRWPALEVSAKRERLQRSLRIAPGRSRPASAPPTRRHDAPQPACGRRDPATWSRAADVQATIANRPGWLDSPALMADSLDRLRSFAEGVKRDGFTDVVLVGMGGSSLAPDKIALQ